LQAAEDELQHTLYHGVKLVSKLQEGLNEAAAYDVIDLINVHHRDLMPDVLVNFRNQLKAKHQAELALDEAFQKQQGMQLKYDSAVATANAMSGAEPLSSCQHVIGLVKARSEMDLTGLSFAPMHEETQGDLADAEDAGEIEELGDASEVEEDEDASDEDPAAESEGASDEDLGVESEDANGEEFRA